MDYIFFTSKLEQCSLLIIHVLDRSRDVLCWDVFLSFYILTLSSCRALKKQQRDFWPPQSIVMNLLTTKILMTSLHLFTNGSRNFLEMKQYFYP